MYRILFPAALVMMLSACVKEEVPGGAGGGEGDSIILDIASETLPLMKSEASGAEIAVDHLDVRTLLRAPAIGFILSPTAPMRQQTSTIST